MNQQTFIEFLEDLIEDEPHKVFPIVGNLRAQEQALHSVDAVSQGSDRTVLFRSSVPN